MTTFAYPAPLRYGDQVPVARSADDRFTVYKTTGREHGARGAAPFTLYTVYDAETGRTSHLRNRNEINSLIHYRLTGERLGRWFSVDVAAPVAQLLKVTA